MVKGDDKLFVIIFLSIIGFILFLAINKLSEVFNLSESFGMQTYSRTNDCKRFSSEYPSCNSFLETIDNGGIQQTPLVRKCADICRVEQYGKNLPY